MGKQISERRALKLHGYQAGIRATTCVVPHPREAGIFHFASGPWFFPLNIGRA